MRTIIVQATELIGSTFQPVTAIFSVADTQWPSFGELIATIAPKKNTATSGLTQE